MALTIVSFDLFKRYLLRSWLDHFKQVDANLNVISMFPIEDVKMQTQTLGVRPLPIERFTTYGINRYVRTELLQDGTADVVYRTYYDAIWQIDLFTEGMDGLLEWSGKIEKFLFDNSGVENSFKVSDYTDEQNIVPTSNTVRFKHSDVDTTLFERDRESYYRQIWRIPFICSVYTKENVNTIQEWEVIMNPIDDTPFGD